ncbi:hypothetical protein SCA6_004028 [Theobroma cacao]
MVKGTRRLFLISKLLIPINSPWFLSYLKSNSSHRKKGRRIRQELAAQDEERREVLEEEQQNP